MENRAPNMRFTVGAPVMRLVANTEPPLSYSDDEHSWTGSSSSDPPTPDCESRLTGVKEEDREHEIIEQKLVSGLRMHTTIESIQRNHFSSSMKKAKLLAFSLFAKAVEEKSGVENGNVQFAWFGASKEELTSILQHGFAASIIKDGSFGHGLYLCPDNFPLGCMDCATADENGTRHLLYCRVILGKTEVVRPGSRQWHPSSQEFDCGVDDLVSPKKYIVWSTNINTHILPHCIISFTISTLNHGNSFGIPRISISAKKPNSSRITIPSLISELEKVLSPEIMQLITKYVKDHREGKITRLEMIKCLRRVAGDELLITIVKAQRDMEINATIGLPENKKGVRRNC